ncbi:GAF domain-containing protein [Sphingomonas sp.]|uniref:GAF domain-containing protein n=1 Tax=Sphingomonas sp. TaxID=28214 RepID=UPI002DD62A73|nr:GAF domain-containing protein [Sphingomonas sp.]
MIRWFGRRGKVDTPKALESGDFSPSPIDAIRARLAESDSVDDVIATLREMVRPIIGADGITVVQREGDEVVYVTEDAVAPLWAGQRFPIRVCISGMAIQARAPIVIPNILEDKRVPLNAYLATFVRSMVMVPVGHGEPHMAMGAYWRVAEPITSIAVDRMSAIAAVAADALARIEGGGDEGVQVA